MNIVTEAEFWNDKMNSDSKSLLDLSENGLSSEVYPKDPLGDLSDEVDWLKRRQRAVEQSVDELKSRLDEIGTRSLVKIGSRQ